MRTPRRLGSADEDREEAVLVGREHYGTRLFFPDSLESEKTYASFVRKAEALARRSPELKAYIQFLKDEADLGRCHFFRNVSNSDVSVEMHHHPFTLFDVTDVVALSAIRTGSRLTTFSVANEVVRLHYEGLVGLVPICETVHQLAHSGLVFIPPGAVHGDVRGFLRRFRDDLRPDHLAKLASMLETTPGEAAAINSVLEEVQAVRDDSPGRELAEALDAVAPGSPRGGRRRGSGDQTGGGTDMNDRRRKRK